MLTTGGGRRLVGGGTAGPEELGGKDFVDAFEGAGELEGVGEAETKGGFFDDEAFVEEHVGGVGHAGAEQKLICAGVAKTAEKAGDVLGGDLALGGDVFDGAKAKGVLLDVAAELLVGGIGAGNGAAGGEDALANL